MKSIKNNIGFRPFASSNESGHAEVSSFSIDWAFILIAFVIIAAMGFGLIKARDDLIKRRTAEAEVRPQIQMVTNVTSAVVIAEVKGHLYLIFKTGVCHDEACPCKTK